MLISFKSKTSVAKVVQVNIAKLNTEMIDILRQLYFPITEKLCRYRKISGCHTQGYACLMDEKHVSSVLTLFYRLGEIMKIPIRTYKLKHHIHVPVINASLF